METERILIVVRGLQGQVGAMGLPRRYDLVLTNERIAGIATANLTGAMVAGGLGGAIGGAIAAAAIQKKARENREDYTPNRLGSLVSKEKTSFAAAYEDVEKAKVSGWLSRTFSVTTGGRTFPFPMTKPQWGRLAS